MPPLGLARSGRLPPRRCGWAWRCKSSLPARWSGSLGWHEAQWSASATAGGDFDTRRSVALKLSRWAGRPAGSFPRSAVVALLVLGL